MKYARLIRDHGSTWRDYNSDVSEGSDDTEGPDGYSECSSDEESEAAEGSTGKQLGASGECCERTGEGSDAAEALGERAGGAVEGPDSADPGGFSTDSTGSSDAESDTSSESSLDDSDLAGEENPDDIVESDELGLQD